jgi:hypothetical protein
VRMRLLDLRFAVGATGAALVAVAGCGSHDEASNTATFTLQTPTVQVAANKERYVCYAQTLDEDLTIDRYDYAVVPFVHHVVVARTLAPEQDGVSECDVLFKTTWVPLLVAGKGSATLEDPAGAATVLPKGTQILVQLHLLNASSSDANVAAAIDMHRSSLAAPKPVGLYAFGTQIISLGAGTSSVSYECTPDGDVESFAEFPHMHKLGTKVTFEVADAAGAFHEIYRRDPYDFNNQSIDPTPVLIPKGTKTRVTCTYDNKTGAAVTFGESTSNEMCYLAMFVTNQGGVNGCVQTSPPGDGGQAAGDGAAGGTCKAVANSIGIGGACTAGGGQCPSGLQCSTDLGASSDPAGFCMKIGCAASADCGNDATCCAPAQGGGVEVCLPNACLPADCPAK